MEKVTGRQWGQATPRVPDTISDKHMKDLQRRGGKANSWFSPKAQRQQKASEKNLRNSWWN
jgi:hypothetical protein